MDVSATRWNHNTHYYRLILDAVPAGAHSALDVGCGDGVLADQLQGSVSEVVGIDVDEEVLRSARKLNGSVSWVNADVLSYEFGRTFDVVASVATLHHMPDLEAALSRMASLTAPGGVLAIIGVARSSRPRDLLLHAVGSLQHRWLVRKHGYWNHSAQTLWPPAHDYATVWRVARRVLPGAKWKQLPLWRYSLIWNRPV
ncbi:class I SAM-dependent methyltransferase [Leucobacter aridicollis]|uniref:class I SAM-dependent methyltransferase n=1 Tax=Leucobacter aridicollis TaxID=283878 RepID=UPI0037CA8213